MKELSITALIAAGVLLTACGKEQSEPVAAKTDEVPACSAQEVADVQLVEIAAGLTGKTFATGCGDAAKSGQLVVVHYTGWLLDSEAEDNRGDKFDSSRDRDQPFNFPLGAGRVIKGWDSGVVGMQIGEIRELTIAPEMAYGDRNDIAVIPAGSTLVFEIELIALDDSQPAANDAQSD